MRNLLGVILRKGQSYDLALLLRRTALNWMKENVRRFVE